jgi:hypothetical protein
MEDEQGCGNLVTQIWKGSLMCRHGEKSTYRNCVRIFGNGWIILRGYVKLA